MKLKWSHFLNRKREEQYAKIFQGIANGRKRALENWFNDIWVSLEQTKDTILSYLHHNDVDYDKMIEILEDKKRQFTDFSEIFIVNQEGVVNISTYKGHLGRIRKDLPNYKYGMEMKPYMYGPYIDKESLDVGRSSSKFLMKLHLCFQYLL